MLHPRLTCKPYYTPKWPCAFVLCLVLATTSACAQAGGKNYFPIADGATWEYIGSFSAAGGQHLSIRATSRVDGESLINGRRYFKFVTISDFSGVPSIGKRVEDVRYYRIAEDGIYVRPGTDPDKPELLEMPTPIPLGLKWLSGATEVWAEHVGTIKVNRRDYTDCLKVTYKMSGGLRVTENYLAPGVGIIKVVYVNTTAPQSTAELMLERYTSDKPKKS